MTCNKTSPLDNEISVLALGCPGVGKSTIGNFLLTGRAEGVFDTGVGVDSCSKEARCEKRGNVSFTDLPGIPDTDPKNTKLFYNICVEEVNKPHSALLFVFGMGRIDRKAYTQAEILFREINRASCMNFLVINDRNGYKFGAPPDDVEYVKLAETIKEYTKINFNGRIFMNSDSIGEKLSNWKDMLMEWQVEPVKPPELNNFDDMVLWVEGLTEKKNVHEAIFREKQEELLQLERRLEMLLKRRKALAMVATTKFGGVIGLFTLPFFTVEAIVDGNMTTAVSLLDSRNYGTWLSDSIKTTTKQIRVKEDEIKSGSFDQAAKELETAKANFLQLKKAIDDTD